MLNERLGVLATIEPYIGKYYSTQWVRSKVLRQTDSEQMEMDEQIEQEIRDGVIPDPSAVDPITGEPLPQEGEQGMMIKCLQCTSCARMFDWLGIDSSR